MIGWHQRSMTEATAIAEEQRLQDEQEVSQRAKPGAVGYGVGIT